MELMTYTPLWGLLALPVLGAALWLSLVDRPRALRIAAFVLRAVGVLLLVLALCRPFVSGSNRDLHVAFLVDVSESVDLDAARASIADIEQSIDQLGGEDTWSLFAVGKSLRRFESPQALRETLTEWQEHAPDDEFRSATHLGEAMRAARLAFPGGKARRLVLLTDGQPTGENVGTALDVLREEGVDVRRRSIEGLSAPEAAVVSVRPSTPNAFKGEIVRLSARLAANQAMDGELRIVHRGAIVARKKISLESGSHNEVNVDVGMHTPGESVWTAELVPDEDHFPINNRASATVSVRGQPRLLVLHRDEGRMRDFARAMQQQEFVVDVRPPRGLPASMNELRAFDAVILADVAATELSPRQMQLLNRYVADFGGGLAMLGSENSFGLGGYYQTPVEEVLPLISRFEKEKEKPSMAMAIVIDKSGSMSGMKIALARQAAKAAVDLLSTRDQIGVVAFDSQPYIAVDMTPAGDRSTIKAQINRIAAGGGTYMYNGMAEAKRMLETTSAKIKHMIVLGDGQTGAADHMGLVREMVDMNVTVSTVALGSGAARGLMARIAELGKGRYYQTMDPANVPQIFTRETVQASRSAIKEDVYASVQVNDHPMLAGYEGTQLPFTLGYVMTKSKPTAQVLLATSTGDPLLAISRFGLGTAMAYTSDLTTRWGAQWIAWPQFGKFWSQAMRALVRKEEARGMRVDTRVEDGRWHVRIERHNDAGEPMSDITWDALVLDENGQTEPVRVEAVGLGRYEASVPLKDRSRLMLRLHDTDHNRMKTVRYHRPYPPEYRLGRQAPAAIEQLAGFSPSEVRAGLQPVEYRWSADWLAILLAMACMIAGLALRRV